MRDNERGNANVTMGLSFGMPPELEKRTVEIDVKVQEIVDAKFGEDAKRHIWISQDGHCVLYVGKTQAWAATFGQMKQLSNDELLAKIAFDLPN